jgi:hypothetical protein
MRESEYDDGSGQEDLIDEDPIPARRDTRIFSRKSEVKEKEEDFDEDKFV